jgi:hypothetical protein
MESTVGALLLATRPSYVPCLRCTQHPPSVASLAMVHDPWCCTQPRAGAPCSPAQMYATAPAISLTGRHHGPNYAFTSSASTPPCRAKRLHLPVDDTLAAPVTTPFHHSMAMQLLLASHQLCLATMASHHRCRHRTDSPRYDGIAPSR